MDGTRLWRLKRVPLLASGDLVPQPGAAPGQGRKARLYIPSPIGRTARQQLFDVPNVLRAAGIQLQEDEIGSLHDGDLSVAKPGRARAAKDLVLPARPANNQIDITLTGGAETDEAGHGIVKVAPADVSINRPREAEPRCRSCRQRGSVARRSRSNVERVTPCAASAPAPMRAKRMSTFVKRVDDLREQAHRAGSRQGEGYLPDWRRRIARRRPADRDRRRPSHSSSRSTSPSSKASRIRSEGDSLASFCRVSRRAASRTDCMGSSISRRPVTSLRTGSSLRAHPTVQSRKFTNVFSFRLLARR